MSVCVCLFVGPLHRLRNRPRRSDGDSLDPEGEDNPAFDYPEEEDTESDPDDPDGDGDGPARRRRRAWDEDDDDEEDEDGGAHSPAAGHSPEDMDTQ